MAEQNGPQPQEPLNDQRNELVEVRPDGEIVTRPGATPAERPVEEVLEGMLASWDKSAGGALTSLDLETEEGQVKASEARLQADLGAREAVGHTFHITDYYVHGVQVLSDDGRRRPMIRLVMFTKEGPRIGTVSEPIIREMGTIRQQMGPGPYDPAIPVTFSQHKGRGPNSFCAMRRVKRETVVTPKRSGRPSQPD